MTTKKVIIQWDPPRNPDTPEDVYDNLDGYELHHNLPNESSPLFYDSGTITTRAIDVPEGLYHVGLQAVNTDGYKSEKVLHSFEVANAHLNPNATRDYNIPLGGVLSTECSIDKVTGIFRTLNATGWSFASAGTPQYYNTFQNGHANRYSQDCSDVARLDFSDMTEDEEMRKSHYIIFDASDSDDPLKLVKWEDQVYSDTNNLKLSYWYDTGTGNTTAESTFVEKTGAVTVAVGTTDVIGVGTSFTTEYAVDDIIYFNSAQAGIVTYIHSDTRITIDRVFTTAISIAGTLNDKIKKQGLTIDPNYDAVLYIIRNDDSGDEFKRFPFVTIDPDVFTRSRVATLQAAPIFLNFDSTPTLTTSYTNLVLTAVGNGFISPKFKITGTGFNNSEISQTADSSFQDPTSGKTYVKTLDKVDAFVTTDLDFTVTVTEESDESNTELQSTQDVTIPFIKDGAGSGATGVDAKSVHLTVDDYSIIYDADGSTPSPSGSMTLTASSQNFTDPYFKFTGDGITDETGFTDGTDDSDTFSFVIPTSHFSTPKSLRVGVSEAATSTTEVAFDSITITAVKPGATGPRGIDGMTFVITNEAHVFNASLAGVVSSYAGSGTIIEVYEGGTELVYDGTGTSDSTWKTTEAVSNITVGTKTDSGNYLTVGDHSGVADGTNDSKIIYTITGKRADGTSFTAQAQQSFTKSTKGATGLQGIQGIEGDDGAGIEYIFAVTADSSTSPSAPNNDWGFDSPESPWYDAAPSITTTNKALWRSQRAIIGTPAVDDDVDDTWSLYTVVGRFADDGEQGIQGATGDDGAGIEYIFAVTADTSTTPSDPSNSWNFDSPQSPWYDAAPSITTTNKALWRAQRAIEGTPTTSDSVDDTWSSSTVVGRFADDGEQGIQGIEGARGDDGAGIEYIFAVTADSSTTPSATNNDWGFDNPNNSEGWYDAAPSITTTNKALWRAQRAIVGAPAVDDDVDDTWSSSTVVGRFGDTGETGDTGLRTTSGYIYYNTLQASAPTAPSGGTYTWAGTGTPKVYFTTIPSGWSLTAPSITGGNSTDIMYYAYYSVHQSSALQTTNEPAYSGVYTATNFTGLVRFNGTNKVQDGVGGSLSFGSSGTTEIDGAKITTGHIDADRLNVGSIDISGFNNDSGFTDNTVANTKTTAAAALAASNAAEKAAGKVGGWTITSSAIQGGAGVYIGGAKTSYESTTAGWWIGQASGSSVAKLNIGDASNYLKWKGDGLDIKGDITLNNASTTDLSTFRNDAAWTDDTVANTKTTLAAANAAVNANVTSINANVIVNGYLNAARIEASSLNAGKIESNTNTITGTSNKFAFNGTTSYAGFDTVVGSEAHSSSTFAGLFFGTANTGVLGAQTSYSGQNAGIFANSPSIGSLVSRNSVYLANDTLGSKFTDDSKKWVELAHPSHAGYFKDDAKSILVQVLSITNGGSGYTSAPTVTFTNAAGDTTGSGAAATGVTDPLWYSIYNGAIIAIGLTSLGTNYTAAPTVTITGGGGTGATATANITQEYVKICSGTHALFYEGAIGTFTAGHDALLSDSETCEIGDILVDQGVAYAKSVSDIITNVTRSTSTNQKSVIGVFVQENPTHVPVPLSKEVITTVGTGPSTTTSSTHIIDPIHDSIMENKAIIAMNSVGEGQVNVCGENGDIEIGDLISSSSTTGKGMKQDDDIVRSCTVGKAREAVTFASASSTARLACIYMCG